MAVAVALCPPSLAQGRFRPVGRPWSPRCQVSAVHTRRWRRHVSVTALSSSHMLPAFPTPPDGSRARHPSPPSWWVVVTDPMAGPEARPFVLEQGTLEAGTHMHHHSQCSYAVGLPSHIESLHCRCLPRYVHHIYLDHVQLSYNDATPWIGAGDAPLLFCNEGFPVHISST